MKIINLIGKILYGIIMLIIIISGFIGIGSFLQFIGITGSLNSTLQYVLFLYGIGMFVYETDKIYKKGE